MSIEMFLEKTNIYLLWDVLIDEPMIKQICNSQIKMKELQTIFETNLKAFYAREKNSCNSLVNLNKKYILLLINYIVKLQDQAIDEITRQNSHQNQTNQTFKKIKIHEDDTTQQQITYEDIHNERISKFEKELTKKQEEFTNSMSVSVPPTPNFNDKLDEPINEIELEIKRIQEQRNYDIELINRSYNNSENSSNQSWLTSQETSIKNEKLNLDFQRNMNANTNINTNTNTNKHITWSNENQFYEPASLQEYGNNPETTHDNIFTKLKKVESVNYQTQIDELKNEVTSLHNKINTILEKMTT